MQEIAPYLVVGSGCTGAAAAGALLDAGAAVSMVDVGHVADRALLPAPGETFHEIHSSRADQHRLFLGDALESLTLARSRAGAQLTPPRRHIVEEVERLLPVSSESFAAFESLAYGGLGAGWGLGCNVFSVRELREAGLDPTRDASQLRARRRPNRSERRTGRRDAVRRWVWTSCLRFRASND